MRRQLGPAEATPGQQRGSEGTSGYEEGSRPQGTGWENEQVWRGSDGKKESPPSRISRTASPYPPLSHPAPTSPHLPSTRQPGRPPPASLARAELGRGRSLVTLGSGSMAPLGLSERACSRVPVAFGGFLGLPPCKRHAEATTLGLWLLARPVDQHDHTTGLYQKMTARRPALRPTRLRRTAVLEDHSSWPALRPTWPHSRAGPEHDSSRPALRPTWPHSRPVPDDGSSPSALRPTWPHSRAGPEHDSSRPVLRPTWPHSRAGPEHDSSLTALRPTQPHSRAGPEHVCWVDPGWTPGAHQSRFIAPPYQLDRGEKIKRKARGSR